MAGGLTLGSIQFTQREIPDTINFGGKQKLAIHRNIGGTRVIDAMGPDPAPIKWAGKFYGTNAASRARSCDELRKAGMQVRLSWGSFSYQVVVSNFHAVYKHEWEIRYQIEVEVVTDGQATQFTPTLTQAVTNDLSSITAISSANPSIPALPGSSTITPAMTTALGTATSTMNTVVGSGSLDNLSLPQLQSIISAFQVAFAAFTTIAPTGINLDAATGASTLDGITSFTNEAGLVAAESDVQLAQFYLGRIIGNLTSWPA